MIDDMLKFRSDEVASSLKVARNFLKGNKVYENVKNLDPEDPMMSKEAFLTMRALEEGLAATHLVYMKLEDILAITKLTESGVGQERITEKREVVSLYSLFVGCSIIGSKLCDLMSGIDISKARMIASEKISFKNYNLPVNNLLDELSKLANEPIMLSTGEQKIPFLRDGIDLAHVTNVLFSSVSSYCLEKKAEFEENGHRAALVDVINRTSLELFDVRINGFEPIAQATKQSLQPIKYSDIVGNNALVNYFRSATEYLLNFNPVTRTNEEDELGGYANKVLLTGPPGTGKTTTIQAFLFDTQKRAEERGLGFEYISIGNDIKDKYFGESVKKLKAKFDKVNKGDKIYVITIEDIDAIFAARDDPEASPAEKDILHELMNTLEGIGSSDLGNCIIVSSSNLTTSGKGGSAIDEALLGRIAEEQVEVLGPETPSDFSRLLEIKLRKGIKAGYVDISKINDIGKLCYEEKISGRGIKNITKSAMSCARPVSYPAEVYDIHNKEERIAAKLSHFNKITYDTMVSNITRYIETGKRNEELAAKQRLENRTKQIIYEIRSQDEARKQLAGIGLHKMEDSPEFDALSDVIYSKFIGDNQLKTMVANIMLEEFPRIVDSLRNYKNG